MSAVFYRLLSRLTPPLCLNFLSLIHLDSHVTRAHDIVETAYTHVNLFLLHYGIRDAAVLSSPLCFDF